MKNLTVGRPIKLIVLFAIPLLIGNLFQQVYLIADTMIVGRLIGVDALAGVGATGPVMFLVIGFSQAMTMGFSIVTAQHFGAKNEIGVRRSFAASVLLSIVMSVLLTILMIYLLPSILHWINTPEEIYHYAYDFAHVIFLGIVATVVYNLLANTILALGDPRPPLIFLIISCFVNVGLDLWFILGLGMGVEGAALATVSSQCVAALLCIAYIAWRLPILRIDRSSLRLKFREVLRTFRIGLPMGFQISIIALGSIFLQAALNGLGPTSVAAYTVSMRIDFVAIMIFQSLGLACSTFVAQNFGARNIARVQQGVRQASYLTVVAAILVGAFNIFVGHYIVEFFVGPGNPEVMRLSRIFLTINGSTYIFVALLFIYRGTLQGLGQTFAPTFAGIMELLMRGFAGPALIVPLGFAGACLSNPLSWILACVPLAIVYAVSIRRLLKTYPDGPKEIEPIVEGPFDETALPRSS